MGPLPGPKFCPINFENHIEYAMILHLTMPDIEKRASVKFVIDNYLPVWREQIGGEITA